MKNAWMVRSEGGQLIDLFTSNNIIAIGWNELGNLSQYKSKDDIFNKIMEVWPENSQGKSSNITGILYRFSREIKRDDIVVTYDPPQRMYHIGEIKSSYQYRPDISETWPNVLEIKWTDKISRDCLSVTTKNSLGSTLTLFSISDKMLQELLGKGNGTENGKPSLDTAENEVETIFDDYSEKALEFIKDKITKLDWEEMQNLIAGLLRSMGYKTRVSPRGSDLGKDIIASPDGFGLEQPRIIVEVKHRNHPMGAQEIRSFLGGRHKEDRGLYVSTGGFTKDAKYEADRANIPLTLIDIDDLVKEILNNYESMDTETKLLLPLKKIYWPK
jgi:restriction system protein